VLKIEQWWSVLKKVLALQLTIALVIGTVGCHDRMVGLEGEGSQPAPVPKPEIVISEVSPPETLQELGQFLEAYHPQVTIVSPQPDEVLEDDTVTVQFQVRDLPIFKNGTFGLGPHLHVFLDNQPYLAVYDLSQPLVLSDLSPGTHTLRVFASRPWHESFKNEGAYAQTTFHLYTKTDDNAPDPNLPLLTYSSPQGRSGAEPILLDFYLTNAPLHLIAQESEEDDIVDWRIRCTIDGKSFVIDRWQPLYLTGFRPGKNWVKLEFLDELGNPVKNTFNSTVRIVTYEPGDDDSLSKLIRGELSVEEARGIVDPNYIYEAEIEEPTPESTPEVTEEPLPAPVSDVLEEPTSLPESVPEESLEPISEPASSPESVPKESLEPISEPTSSPESVPEESLEPISEPTSLPESVPEESLEPISEPMVEPEVVAEPEPMPELPREEVLPEEELESDLTTLETGIPGDEGLGLEMTPMEAEMPLEEELAPIAPTDEGEVTIPETSSLEEILSEPEVVDVPELSDIEPELEPMVGEAMESSESTIETVDVELPTEDMVTDKPPGDH
jgi:hypothetical protein